MNPYDDDFEFQQRKSTPLFVPKQVKVDYNSAGKQQAQPVQYQKVRQAMTFQTVYQTQQSSSVPFYSYVPESVNLEAAKLVGNYPYYLPFADNQDKALQLSCYKSHYLARQSADVEADVETGYPIVFPETFLLQLPALLPQNQSTFYAMENCQFGTLQRHASGKMVLKTQNGVEYCIAPGANTSYYQKAVLVDVSEHVVQEICEPTKKFIACLRFE